MAKHLVFAGGGPRAVSFLGAIEILQKHNMLTNVKHYWGNSAGALMATCMSLNTTTAELRRVFFDMDFTKFRDFDINNIMSFSTRWGLDSGDAFTKNIKWLLNWHNIYDLKGFAMQLDQYKIIMKFKDKIY